jgi:hypothetical protein
MKLISQKALPKVTSQDLSENGSVNGFTIPEFITMWKDIWGTVPCIICKKPFKFLFPLEDTFRIRQDKTSFWMVVVCSKKCANLFIFQHLGKEEGRIK